MAWNRTRTEAIRRSNIHCHYCTRPFAKGFIPMPMSNGLRMCSDCRDGDHEDHNPPA